MMFTLGYAQQTITPSLERPAYLAGFGNNRRANAIHDDLFARALSLSDGKTTLVLCALDLIGFFRSDVLDVIQRVQAKFPGVEIVIASTHTHHGPDTMGLWGANRNVSGVDPIYMQQLKDQLTRAIMGALTIMVPCAGLKAAAHPVVGFVKNYRNPEIVDNELTALQFFSPDGKPLATLLNFPCHPEVLPDTNPIISADYPHFLRLEVEAHSGAPCIFYSGALGGMLSPDFPADARTFASAETMGRGIAQVGLQALAEAAAQEPTLSLHKKELKARLTNILYKLAFQRKLLPDVRDASGCVISEVNLIRMGRAWLATVPGEMLPKLGLQLKADLKDAGAQVAGVVGLANDELGYILPVEDFKYPLNPFRPGKHYEETNSIGKDIAPKVMEALRSLL